MFLLLGGSYSPVPRRNVESGPEYMAMPQNHQRTWGQIIDKTDQLFKNTTLYFKTTQFLIYDYGSIPKLVKQMTLGRILNSSMLISKILRFSYGRCMQKEIDQARALTRNNLTSIRTTPKPVSPKDFSVPIWSFPDYANAKLSPAQIAEKNLKIILWTRKFLRRSRYRRALALLTGQLRKQTDPGVLKKKQ